LQHGCADCFVAWSALSSFIGRMDLQSPVTCLGHIIINGCDQHRSLVAMKQGHFAPIPFLQVRQAVTP